MTNDKEFLTITGRWRKLHQAHIDRLPDDVRNIALIIYYAAFSDALDACVEASAFDESTAALLMGELQIEVQQFAATAQRIAGGNPLS